MRMLTKLVLSIGFIGSASADMASMGDAAVKQHARLPLVDMGAGDASNPAFQPRSNMDLGATVQSKAFGELTRDLTFTPLSPCRLIDTRGYGAPIQGGAFSPNERRSYAPNGACGLPTSGVAALQVSFTTENLTPNSGGYLAIVAPGAPIAATVDVFNLGASWSASNTSVRTGIAGQFDVFVNGANANVVIDIIGYYSPPTPGAVGTAQLADGAVTYSKIATGALPSALFYQTASSTGTLAAGFSGSLASPACPAPSYAISGGCLSDGPGAMAITGSFANNAGGWTCRFANFGSVTYTGTVFAICLAPPAASK